MHRNQRCRAPMALLLAAALLSPEGAAAADVELRGRFHLDAAHHLQERDALDDGVLMRRARLGARGSFDDVWTFRLEVDFAEEQLSAQDAWVSRHWRDVSVQVGQFKVPFSLEQQTSSNRIPLMERSLANGLVPGRRMGAAVAIEEARWGATAGVFGRAAGEEVVGNQPFLLAGRATFTPVAERHRVVHLGASALREDTDELNRVRFRARPESRVDGARLLDTGWMARSTAVASHGVEAAWMTGNLLLQGEYVGVEVAREHTGRARFSGYYAQVSYAFGGGSYRYRGPSRGFAVRGRPAWELAARYSRLDLNSHGAEGGEAGVATVGLTRYVTPNVRIMANYAHTRSVRPEGIPAPAILQGRLQVAF